MRARPPKPTLFPYTTLFRSSDGRLDRGQVAGDEAEVARIVGMHLEDVRLAGLAGGGEIVEPGVHGRPSSAVREHERMVREIGRAHVRTPVTPISRMPSSA